MFISKDRIKGLESKIEDLFERISQLEEKTGIDWVDYEDFDSTNGEFYQANSYYRSRIYLNQVVVRICEYLGVKWHCEQPKCGLISKKEKK